MKEKAAIKMEETLLFMTLVTFVGGFVNAYTFLMRGGTFVSMHTGNMARLGIFLYLGDWGEVAASISPIIACLLGAGLAHYIKIQFSKHSILFWQKLSLILEMVALFAVGFLPTTVSNIGINWFLAVVTGFQLNNFRQYEGAVHNTTICTGNLRTLGQYVCELLLKHNLPALRGMCRYFVLAFSFPLGACIGGFSSGWLGVQSIWVACLALAACVLLLSRKAGAKV